MWVSCGEQYFPIHQMKPSQEDWQKLVFKRKNCSVLEKLSSLRNFFQYYSGDLVYIISPLTSQLHSTSRKVTIKYIGPMVIYKIIDPHKYLLMTLNCKILKGLCKHERLEPTNIRTSQGH